ncbi:1,4-dihydroxy-2-naphthoate polyprenyltransferase [Candidatus Kapabacteria bacterium]|nr:1,4-dihydroxy-2-naphthoate polyprenyltransferase [Candidatus Kapabacteria bacterium]
MATAKDWIEAIRPKTLPAGIVPVCIGSAYSNYQGNFNWTSFGVILFCSVMIQIITNFFNEIFDFKKGADTEERVGPARGVSTGAISLKSMWLITILSLIVTFVAGLYLVTIAGLPILIIGLSSLILSWLYTGGPFPLAYKGLGDIFVLIFFGFVATAGTYYTFHQDINEIILLLSLIPGLTSMNILAVNNIRDIDTDIKVNKKTLPVRIGRTPARLLFSVISIATYFVIFTIYSKTNIDFVLWNFATLPLYLIINIMVFKITGAKLNKVLALTGLQLMLFGLITSFSFL